MSSHAVPEVLMKKVDEYVDSLAPQIQPRITSELEVFQQKTIDSLETQVVDAFRSLFNKDKDGGGSRSLNDTAPDSYGGQSLPFADEIAKLTRSFSTITDEAGDDLRDIFDITEGRDGPGENRSRGVGHGDSSKGAKGFLSAALNVVQDHLDSNSKVPGGQRFELDGLLGVLSNTVKDAARNPEEKARLISPEIKEQVGAKLREQHAPLAEQFTRIALSHIKHWLRGNTSTKDLGDGVKGEIEDQVKDLVKGLGGLFGNKKPSSEGSARGFGHRDSHGDEGERESSGGFSKVISDKLSTGLARVHRNVRLEFRKILGGIEKQLFELLPAAFQRPLKKILGGNPFDTQLDRDAAPNADRGFGDDIKAKLVSKIRGLVRKVQETLRESILGVVNGGHRKFERESWVLVQGMVEQKVHKYLPKVKISVPDDIGNEGVSVGAPTASAQLGGGNQPVSSPQGGYAPPPSHDSQGSYPPPPSHASEGGYPPPPSHASHGSYPPPPSHDSQGSYPSPPSHDSQGSYPPPPSHDSQGSYPPPPSHELQGSYPPPPSHELQGSYPPPPSHASQGGYAPPPSHEQHGGQTHAQQGYSPPEQYQQHQEYRPDSQQQHQEYRPEQHQSHQEYRPDQYQPPQQPHSQQYQSNQPQGYQQGQHGQNPQY